MKGCSNSCYCSTGFGNSNSRNSGNRIRTCDNSNCDRDSVGSPSTKGSIDSRGSRDTLDMDRGKKDNSGRTGNSDRHWAQ